MDTIDCSYTSWDSNSCNKSFSEASEVVMKGMAVELLSIWPIDDERRPGAGAKKEAGAGGIAIAVDAGAIAGTGAPPA